jgi:hypothetical protein
VIRVDDDAGNVIEADEHDGVFESCQSEHDERSATAARFVFTHDIKKYRKKRPKWSTFAFEGSLAVPKFTQTSTRYR